MKKEFAFFIASLIILVFGLSSCTVRWFIQKQREVDLLPPTMSADSVRIMPPIFSGHRVSDAYEVEYQINLPQREDFFINEVKRQLEIQGLDGLRSFYGNSLCMKNKMHIENFDSDIWYTPETYRCLKLNDSLYNIIFSVRMESVEMISYSAAPMNDRSNVFCQILIFKNKKLFYAKNYRYGKSLKRKEQKALENGKDYPFFKDDQIKYVIEKVTEDLFKRIKTKYIQHK